jgi:hypothetical protein
MRLSRATEPAGPFMPTPQPEDFKQSIHTTVEKDTEGSEEYGDHRQGQPLRIAKC